MKQKPFDILLIEGAYEYQELTSERVLDDVKQRIRGGLRELGDICRSSEIPVRVIPRKGWAPKKDPNIEQTEHIYRHFFEGCDYQTDFDLQTIGLVTNSHPMRIVLTGGIVRYEFFDSNSLGQVCFIEGLDLQTIETPKLKGEDRTTALLWGCVPGCGEDILNQTSQMNNKPEVYIDSVSAVNSGDPLDFNSVYRVTKLQTDRYGFIGNGDYVITEKVPRDKVIHRD